MKTDNQYFIQYKKGTNDISSSNYAHRFGNKKSSNSKKKLLKNSFTIDKSLFSGDIYNWLKSIKISCKCSTYSNYEYTIYTHLIPNFGNYKRRELNKEVINEFTTRLLNDGYAPKTVKDILIILKQIFKYVNLSIDITMPKVKKREIQILTNDHQKKLENYLINNINIDSFGIFLCLYTGLRIGELCALKWENIDLDNEIIYVQKTLIRVRNYDSNTKTKTIVILDDPKSISSIRNIPIPKFILPILKSLKKDNLNDVFFLTGKHTFIEPRSYTNHYRNIMKKLAINVYNFHALRHTFATRCIENGCDPKTLSEILGHSSVNITLERYVHPSFDSKIIMMNNLSPMCPLSEKNCAM